MTLGDVLWEVKWEAIFWAVIIGGALVAAALDRIPPRRPRRS